MNTQMKLNPAQRLAYDRVLAGIAIREVLVLQGPAGAGKSAILQMVHAAMGGGLLGIRQLTDREAMEETFLGTLDAALSQHKLVLVDDLHLVTNLIEGADGLRALLFDAALTSTLGDAAGQHKKVVFATSGEPPWPVRRRAFTCVIGESAGSAEASQAWNAPPARQ